MRSIATSRAIAASARSSSSTALRTLRRVTISAERSKAVSVNGGALRGDEERSPAPTPCAPCALPRVLPPCKLPPSAADDVGSRIIGSRAATTTPPCRNAAGWLAISRRPSAAWKTAAPAEAGLPGVVRTPAAVGAVVPLTDAADAADMGRPRADDGRLLVASEGVAADAGRM